MDHEVFDNVKYEKARAMAFMFISWSWTYLPAAVKFSGDLLLELSVYIFNPHVVFLIGNTIIVSVLLLCRRTEADNHSVTGGIHRDDVRSREVQLPILTTCDGDVATSSPSGIAEPNFAGDESKQIDKVQSNAAETTIDVTTKNIQILQRTKSEDLKQEIPPKKLRRSQTDMAAVDTLSNEEFKLTIEAFIKKNQIFFEKQRLAETEQEKLIT
ncbi:uncharacterized protein LOC107795496 [Nicotiana tabacum]|uniref:Uncharacterized protein LOC107795496 n=2 Tax=Nicotiana TaxID=4085 RepID=A0A1S4AAM4_TOBAC|nr:PREDICTED: uncharacterized protein LOC104213292 [Nicotiana sylvestris]XP_016473639.1 PREDICTED: uncharacterized protein LOC107795496 [Nicotiana tabacum]